MEVVDKKKLVYVHDVDFVPGVAAYDVHTQIDMEKTASGVRLLLSFDAMHDDLWTERATMGFTQELAKLEKVLAC